MTPLCFTARFLARVFRFQAKLLFLLLRTMGGRVATPAVNNLLTNGPKRPFIDSLTLVLTAFDRANFMAWLPLFSPPLGG